MLTELTIIQQLFLQHYQISADQKLKINMKIFRDLKINQKMKNCVVKIINRTAQTIMNGSVMFYS